MERHLDLELKKIKERLLKMALAVETAIENASASLFDRNSDLAEKVIHGDKGVNLYEIEIDELCHEIIALFQPTAGDMRFITMVLKINNDLERMGDQAVNIAEKAMALNQEPPLKPYQDLPQMAQEAIRMLRESIDAFMTIDTDKAKRVLASDDVIDRINEKIYEDIQAILEKKPEHVKTGIGLIMIAHNYERVGDLATNIAEDVIYLKRGIDIRHPRR